jgi:hypothetical protein
MFKIFGKRFFAFRKVATAAVRNPKPRDGNPWASRGGAGD